MATQLADSQPHRIVLIEDDDADAGLVAWALQRQAQFPYVLQHAASMEDYLKLEPSVGSEVILLDLNLPGYGGLDAFRVVAEKAPEAAIVVLTGLDDNDVAMAAVHAGAQDYLVKQNVNPHDICRAIRYAAMRRATQSLLLRLCDDFLAHVSHALRTPLTAATAAVEMLEAGDAGELAPGQQRLASMAFTNLRLLRTMVADLIDSAMVHSGALAVSPRQAVLADVVMPALEALTPLADQAGLTLATDIDESLTAVVDPDRMTQVVTNLVSNSIKFTPQGGTITVAVAACADGLNVEMSVSDTGVGIPASALRYLFDRLYQVPNEQLRSSRGGLGLGLYLCRELIRAQRGEITVQSTVGVGTRFAMTLPTYEDDSRPS